MPIMKAQPQQSGQSAIVMDLSDLEREAANILSRARAEAGRIISDARATADRESLRIREEARQVGHREGYNAGLELGRVQGHDEVVAQTSQQLRELTARWSQTLELFHQNMPLHMADAKTDLVRLALAVAERITHVEALRNRQVVQATVEEALRTLGSARVVALHANPQEMDLLETYLPDLLTKLRSIESVELTADETVAPGGCELRFGAGQIDARLETQLQRIADELLATEDEVKS